MENIECDRDDDCGRACVNFEGSDNFCFEHVPTVSTSALGMCHGGHVSNSVAK